MPRSEIDAMTEFVKIYGAKGLAYIVLRPEGELQSPIVKFLGDELARRIVAETGAVEGDIIFFGADIWRTVCAALGAVRNELGRNLLKLARWDDWKFLWVIDFPLMSYDEAENRLHAQKGILAWCLGALER